MTDLIDQTTEAIQLPNDVHSAEQLALLPEKYLSHDPQRPLLLTSTATTKSGDNVTQQFKYALRPLWFSVLFILIVECLERLTYYGINTTETAYLTGEYGSWSPNMSSVKASSYTSTSIGIAYTAPFIGGIIADGFLGDYWSIIVGVIFFYIPGLVLISLTTFPGLLGASFNMNVLTAGLLALMPIGTGFIKSIVNVFGAKQFHPVLQCESIESYYVNFYVAINIGALVGGITVPLLAEVSMEAAYLVPVCALVLGMMVFLGASRRYVRRPPEKKALFDTLKLIGKAAVCKPFSASKQSQGGTLPDAFVKGVSRLLQAVPVACLVLPFNIVYAQITTVFIIQGEAMEKMGMLDASLISNADPVFVLIMGYLVGSILYPALSARGIHFPTTYKFAVGTFFGLLALIVALIINQVIVNRYHDNGTQVPIIWQIFAYGMVGTGEIFAISTSYEAAFAIAPKEQKGLASAFQLFVTGGLSQFICTALVNLCSEWFPEDNDGSTKTEQYANAEVAKYLWVLFGISILGIFLNLLTPVKNWVEHLKSESLEASLVGHSITTKYMDSDDLKAECIEDIIESTEKDSQEEPTLQRSQTSGDFDDGLVEVVVN